LVSSRMLELRSRKLLGDLERRIHVAERRREDELIAALRELAYDTLGVGTLGYVLDVLGRHLAPECLFHLLAPAIVLKCPAGIAHWAHVDESHSIGLVRDGHRRSAGDRGQPRQQRRSLE